MAGHGAVDDGDADLDDADSVAIEEARTGLDLLLRSLGRPFPPPAPTAPGPVPMVPEEPTLLRRLVFRTPEALAAKDAAEALPVFNMVDDLIRVVSDLLGRSGPKHQRFMDLQELFTETILEVQGIHTVRWLSRGDALLRILAVWPAVIVFLKEFHSAMFLLATSYRFHFFMYFLADVLEQLNFLNKTFQQRQLDLVSLHGQIKRTTSHIESRYVDCGDDFGGGLSRWLLPFIERYSPGKEREVTVEGPDSDGRPSTFKFKLHEDKVKGYEGPCDHDACVEVCTAERIVGNLEKRLSDLDSMSGVRLFLPDEWPKGKSERHARCVEWLNSLETLFKALEAEEILPGECSKKGKATAAMQFLVATFYAMADGAQLWGGHETLAADEPCGEGLCVEGGHEAVALAEDLGAKTHVRETGAGIGADEVAEGGIGGDLAEYLCAAAEPDAVAMNPLTAINAMSDDEMWRDDYAAAAAECMAFDGSLADVMAAAGLGADVMSRDELVSHAMGTGRMDGDEIGSEVLDAVATVATNGMGDGVATAGIATDGSGAEGMMIHAIATDGNVAEGTTTDGTVTVAVAVGDGLATDGVDTAGAATDGVVTEGVVTDGVVTEGVFTEGVVTDGAVTEGVVTEGVVTDGVVTDGVVTDGVVADGVVTEGVVTDRAATDGMVTDGVVTDGMVTEGVVADSTATDTMGAQYLPAGRMGGDVGEGAGASAEGAIVEAPQGAMGQTNEEAGAGVERESGDGSGRSDAVNPRIEVHNGVDACHYGAEASKRVENGTEETGAVKNNVDVSGHGLGEKEDVGGEMGSAGGEEEERKEKRDEKGEEGRKKGGEVEEDEEEEVDVVGCDELGGGARVGEGGEATVNSQHIGIADDVMGDGKAADDVTGDDKTVGDVMGDVKTAGDVMIDDKTAGDVMIDDKTAGDVMIDDKTAGDVMIEGECGERREMRDGEAIEAADGGTSERGMRNMDEMEGGGVVNGGSEVNDGSETKVEGQEQREEVRVGGREEEKEKEGGVRKEQGEVVTGGEGKEEKAEEKAVEEAVEEEVEEEKEEEERGGDAGVREEAGERELQVEAGARSEGDGGKQGQEGETGRLEEAEREIGRTGREEEDSAREAAEKEKVAGEAKKQEEKGEAEEEEEEEDDDDEEEDEEEEAEEEGRGGKSGSNLGLNRSASRAGREEDEEPALSKSAARAKAGGEAAAGEHLWPVSKLVSLISTQGEVLSEQVVTLQQVVLEQQRLVQQCSVEWREQQKQIQQQVRLLQVQQKQQQQALQQQQQAEEEEQQRLQEITQRPRLSSSSPPALLTASPVSCSPFLSPVPSSPMITPRSYPLYLVLLLRPGPPCRRPCYCTQTQHGTDSEAALQQHLALFFSLKDTITKKEARAIATAAATSSSHVREVFGSFRSHIRSLLQSLPTTCPAPQHRPTTTATNSNTTTNNSASLVAAHLPVSQSASLCLSLSPDTPKHLAPKPTAASLPLSQTPGQTALSVTSAGANGGIAISAAASSKPSAPHPLSSPLPHTTTPHPPVSGSKPHLASKTPVVTNPLPYKSPATPPTPLTAASRLPAAPLSSASHPVASHLPASHPPASHPPRTRAALVAKRRSSMQGGKEISASAQNKEAPGERKRGEEERAGEVEERPRETDLDVLLSDAERALSFSAGPAANTPSSSSRSALSSTPWWEGLEEKAAAAAREAEAEEASAAAAGGGAGIKAGTHGYFLPSSSPTASAAAAAAAAAAGASPSSASARAGCQVASILASHLRQSTGGFTAQQASLLQLLLVRPVSSLRKLLEVESKAPALAAWLRHAAEESQTTILLLLLQLLAAIPVTLSDRPVLTSLKPLLQGLCSYDPSATEPMRCSILTQFPVPLAPSVSPLQPNPHTPPTALPILPTCPPSTAPPTPLHVPISTREPRGPCAALLVAPHPHPAARPSAPVAPALCCHQAVSAQGRERRQARSDGINSLAAPCIRQACLEAPHKLTLSPPPPSLTPPLRRQARSDGINSLAAPCIRQARIAQPPPLCRRDHACQTPPHKESGAGVGVVGASLTGKAGEEEHGGQGVKQERNEEAVSAAAGGGAGAGTGAGAEAASNVGPKREEVCTVTKAAPANMSARLGSSSGGSDGFGGITRSYVGPARLRFMGRGAGRGGMSARGGAGARGVASPPPPHPAASATAAAAGRVRVDGGLDWGGGGVEKGRSGPRGAAGGGEWTMGADTKDHMRDNRAQGATVAAALMAGVVGGAVGLGGAGQMADAGQVEAGSWAPQEMEIGPQKVAAAAAVGSVAASVRVEECRGGEGGEEGEEGVGGVMDVGGSRGEGGVGGGEREDADEGQMGAADVGAAGATGWAEEATMGGAAGAMESGEAAEMLGVAEHAGGVGGVGSTAVDGSHVECNRNEPGVAAPVSGRARDGAVCVGVREEEAGVGVMGGGGGSGEGGEEEAVGVRVERSGGECAAAEGNVGSEQTGQLRSPLDEGRQSEGGEAAVAPVPVASSASDLMRGPREEVAAAVGAAVTGELGLEVLGDESEAHPAAAAAAVVAAAAAVGGASGGSGGISVVEMGVGEGAGRMGVKGESGGVNRVLGAVVGVDREESAGGMRKRAKVEGEGVERRMAEKIAVAGDGGKEQREESKKEEEERKVKEKDKEEEEEREEKAEKEEEEEEDEEALDRMVMEIIGVPNKGRAEQHMSGMGGEETAEMRKQVAAMRMGMVLWPPLTVQPCGGGAQSLRRLILPLPTTFPAPVLHPLLACLRAGVLHTRSSPVEVARGESSSELKRVEHHIASVIARGVRRTPSSHAWSPAEPALESDTAEEVDDARTPVISTVVQRKVGEGGGGGAQQWRGGLEVGGGGRSGEWGHMHATACVEANES
ncbi:unnamed protein product [Closterium sp. Naga37s-1]|nr:unnamed protein product [Closterium sp. Naga37s-1]